MAPAGEYNSLIGAISAGADAVYLAGNMYGARASAVNFTEEEIISGLRYAHLLGRKIYLTVNTLTKQSELANLYAFLRPLYLSGLDGVIVQDIGVINYIREAFPGMEVHVSTQACVTSPEGAEYYKQLGAVRVVPARELTLDEIKDITATGIETECFIHGAMCYGYSGLCLFSSFLGGNSGNRGRCKGPCRQPYQLDGKEEYLLSLKDMCTANMMNRLIDAGIYSFKIEGRLKSPSYAAGVTSVYRRVIDYCLENPGKEVRMQQEDIDLLNNLYSRSGSGSGYYDRVSSKKMITLNNGAYNKVSDEDEKKIYDKYIDNPIKCPVSATFIANPGDKARLELSSEINGIIYSASSYSEQIIEVANNPVNVDNIVKNLKKFGNTNFELKEYNIKSDNGFIPASLINNLRRETVDKLERAIYQDIAKREDDTRSIDINVISSKENTSDTIVFVDSINQLRECVESNLFAKYVISEKLYGCLNPNDSYDNLYLELPPVLRKQNRGLFKKYANEINKDDRFAGVFVNQYDGYQLLKSIGFDKEICSNTNIYSYNQISYEHNDALYDMTLAPIELDMKNLKNVNCNNSYILMYGKAPIMQAANCILKTKDKCVRGSNDREGYVYIKDRLKVEFPVRLRCSENLCFNTIYNSKPNSLHKYYNSLKLSGYNRFYFRFTDENSDMVHKILTYYSDIFKGKDINATFDYTNGHIKNGIL